MTSTTDTQLCGYIITTPKRGPKPCKLAHGHEGKHSTAPRREYTPVDMADLATFKIVDSNADRAKLAPKKRGVQAAERSEVMKQYDEYSAQLYAAWTEAGKPKEFVKSPLGKVHVTTDKIDATKFLARKSAQFLGHGVEFGADGVKDNRGRAVVSWRVIDKRERHAS